MAGSEGWLALELEPTGQPTSVVQFPERRARAQVKVSDVERINPYTFYQLNKTLQAVASKTAAEDGMDCFIELISVRGALTSLLSGSPVQIGVSRASAEALLKNVIDILNRYVFEANPESPGNQRFKQEGRNIPEYTWSWFRTQLATFETVFQEEMRDATAYYVPRRGIFYTPALVDAADESFPKEVIQWIPEKTREDWRAAGRCLAFNLFSASGFHVARAVEGTIEAYYQHFAAKPGETLHSWNDYAVELEKLSKASGSLPSIKTVTEIRQMKDDYRNPIMHPRVLLTESDARMLFDNGESLIVAMAQEIGKATQMVSPQLNLVGGVLAGAIK